MNIMVTGGVDFIGSHIAEFFSSKGHSAVVFDNLETGYLHNIPKMIISHSSKGISVTLMLLQRL